MKILWALLFWAVTIPLAFNSILIMKEEHPGYATGLAVIMGLSFCFSVIKENK